MNSPRSMVLYIILFHIAYSVIPNLCLYFHPLNHLLQMQTQSFVMVLHGMPLRLYQLFPSQTTCAQQISHELLCTEFRCTVDIPLFLQIKNASSCFSRLQLLLHHVTCILTYFLPLPLQIAVLPYFQGPMFLKPFLFSQLTAPSPVKHTSKEFR